jgi:ATP-dependent RNA helicase DDX47/RRP3
MEEDPIQEVNEESTTFRELGLCEELCLACEKMGFKKPSKIQRESLPYTLQGKDIIGLAETGSGKTAAFALPVLQSLLNDPQPFYALVMTPTRELALQISQQFEALGSMIGLKTSVLVGGLDLMEQAISLTRKPHIIIGTPGRVADHLQNTKGFSLKNLKFLVLDEADRLLNMDFEKEINLIVGAAPRDRTTFLFSATMTNKVQKLQRACLRKEAVKVEVSSKYQTVETLTQNYLFLPAQYKDTYLIHLLSKFMGNSIIIFTDTTANATKLTLMLSKLSYSAVALFGKLTQNKRFEALNKFKAKGRNILVATDVASRGLDIPSVDLVINYDVPQHSKNYIHRVGRTARAGRSGRAISLVSQYDVQLFQRIESLIKVRMEEFKCDQDEVMAIHEEVLEAQRKALQQIKQAERDEEIDTEEAIDEEGNPIVSALPKKRSKKEGKFVRNKKPKKFKK